MGYKSLPKLGIGGINPNLSTYNHYYIIYGQQSKIHNY